MSNFMASNVPRRNNWKNGSSETLKLFYYQVADASLEDWRRLKTSTNTPQNETLAPFTDRWEALKVYSFVYSSGTVSSCYKNCILCFHLHFVIHRKAETYRLRVMLQVAKRLENEADQRPDVWASQVENVSQSSLKSWTQWCWTVFYWTDPSPNAG